MTIPAKCPEMTQAPTSSNVVGWSDSDGSGEMVMPAAATTATPPWFGDVSSTVCGRRRWTMDDTEASTLYRRPMSNDRTVRVMPGLDQTQNVKVVVATYLNDVIKLVEQ